LKRVGPPTKTGDGFLSKHLYAIGQPIRFRSQQQLRASTTGLYRIVAYRPTEDGDGEPRYLIKSDDERHERIARESELRSS
jgi:hypothetical protein